MFLFLSNRSFCFYSAIYQLLKNLEHCDNLVLFAGNNHVVVVKNFLKCCGFAVEYEQGLLTVNTGPATFQGPRFSQQELVTIFNTAFAASVGLKQCAQCEKQDCSQRCGACKQVYYCSRTCQAAHWALHKAQCNKAT